MRLPVPVAVAIVIATSSVWSPHHGVVGFHSPTLVLRPLVQAATPRMSMVEESIGVDLSIPYDSAARLAYDEWRSKYGKGEFDPVRYASFKSNYETITVANVIAKKQARDSGTDSPPSIMTLNEFGDCTEEEYGAAQAEKASSPTNTRSLLDQAMEAAASQSKASSALDEAANALAEEEKELTQKLGLQSVGELEIALDSLEGIASDGGDLESKNISREARIRLAYLDWCKKLDKSPDEDRFSIFSNNYLAMEEFAKESGKEVTLNEFADRTEEEFEQLQAQKNSSKDKLSASNVNVDEVTAAAAAATAEAERMKARAEVRAKAEAEARVQAEADRKTREEAATKIRALEEERAQKRAAEERARVAQLVALKEWKLKADIERRASDEKERVAQEKARAAALEKAQQIAVADASAKSEENKRRQAAFEAKQRALAEEAANIARRNAREWEEKQKRIAAARSTAARKSSVVGRFGGKKAIENPQVKFELDLSKMGLGEKPKMQKSGFDISALNNFLPSPISAKPKVVSKSPSFSLKPLFSAPSPTPKVKKMSPTPIKLAEKKATPAPKIPAFSFFSLSPSPKIKKIAPTPMPASQKSKQAKSPAFSFFSPPSPSPKVEKVTSVSLPVTKKTTPALKKPAFSFFSLLSPSPKVKQISSLGPKTKSLPFPSAPAVTTKKAPTISTSFSLFSNSAPKKSKVSAPQPSIRLFTKPEPALKIKVAPKIPNRPGTISLFEGFLQSKPTKIPPKSAMRTGTISLSSVVKPSKFKTNAGKPTQTNIPVLKSWRQNQNGSITGIVSNSKNFKTGTEITTSPVPKGAKKGSVIRTSSGSQYLLQ